jgi:rare lipoprotein A
VLNNQYFELALVTQYRFASKDMNQHRWTCLATVVLTTVIGPIATVHARTLPAPIVTSKANYIPVSPQTLPTITPLVVTELETEEVTPATVKLVPTVTKLPVIATITRTRKISTQPHWWRASRSKSQQNGSKKLTPQLPIAKLPPVSYTYNSTVRVTAPFGSRPQPIPTVAAIVNPVAPLPSVVVTSIPQTPAVGPLKTPSPTVAAISSIDKLPVNSLPQVSSIASSFKDRQDNPTFEFGTPVFGINNTQTSQIVNTVIAQVGETIVAPEQSIAIPVEVPKQPTTTPQAATAQPSVVPPSGTGIVKTEPPAATIQPTLDKIVATQSGQASWYGNEAGSRTANGEKYNPRGLTAAHRTLPFGTKVRVTSLKTGKTVTVRINDRGPFHGRRIIDVSAGAAEAIGIKSSGVGNVRVDILATED